MNLTNASSPWRRFRASGVAGIAFLALMLAVFTAQAQEEILLRAEKLEAKGKFRQAASLIEEAIAFGKYSPSEIEPLRFEIERMCRIRKDYSRKKEELYAELKTSMTNLTPKEFASWVSKGWFDVRKIDGQTYFFNSDVSNLYFRHPELNARRNPATEEKRDAEARLVLDAVRTIKAEAARLNTNYVFPKTYHVWAHATVSSNAVLPGETVKAWLPVPRVYPFQYGFKLISASASPMRIAPDTSPIRSIYFQVTNQSGAPPTFSVEYEFVNKGVYFALNPANISKIDPLEPALKPYLQECPHVVFTPEMKALSMKIVGKETNPMLRAKKIYDWQCEHLFYSYAREYSTLTNISDYVRRNGYGDCGQQALFFIALCRYNGVPARWQSGWHLLPGGITIHDWSEIYLAPYGWIPVDPCLGNYAMRYYTTYSTEEQTEVRDFYFGGLDQYRMIANSDHNQILEPAKKFFRSDDVDFQRAEIETTTRNLYFDQFSYGLRYTTTNSAAVQ